MTACEMEQFWPLDSFFTSTNLKSVKFGVDTWTFRHISAQGERFVSNLMEALVKGFEKRKKKEMDVRVVIDGDMNWIECVSRK
jgi:hypothetical protein